MRSLVSFQALSPNELIILGCSLLHASKAAVRAYGESLRLEMAPLGVRVITIMTGIISTKFFQNIQYKPNLPPDSPFKRASKEISAIASGSLIEGGMTPSEYARRVTDDVLGGTSGSIWREKMASMAWAMISFFPSWLLVSYVLSSGACSAKYRLEDVC